MTTNNLPKYIQPVRMAEQSAVLHGKLDLALFTRLKDLLADNQGWVEVSLQFGKDQEHYKYVCGEIGAKLHLICQRCLKPFDYQLQAEVSLSPTLNEAAANKLPARYEPLLISEDKLLLLTMVEDELLLGLPMAPRHANGECAF
jgi:uncharacterized protein